MIETRHLSLRVGRKPLIEGISTSLPRGKLTAIIGPNGAGKSSLLSAMGRLTNADEGTVFFDGTPVGAFDTHKLAQRLCILKQSNEITPRLTVTDLVRFGRFPHCLGRPSPKDHDIVRTAIDRMALQTIRNRNIDTLSGGQRQRALIAMALAQDAQTLLLDEPLNNLDLVHTRRVMSICREEVGNGRTVAIVLHDLTIAAVHADHVIALKNGQLHSAGPVEDIMTKGKLSDLYDADIQVADVAGQRVVLTV